MQWWNDILDALRSTTGQRLLTTAVVPFVAILIAGIIAAVIGRGSARRLIEWHDREAQASAVATLIGASRRAAVWGSLTGVEKDHVDALTSEAEIRVRMLPLAGSTMAADWAAHELADLRRTSVSFSFQSEQSLAEFRNRLIDWQQRPRRAKKLFRMDLERWRYEQPTSDDTLLQKQQQWLDAQDPTMHRRGESSATAARSAAARPAPTVPAPIAAEPSSPAPAAPTSSTTASTASTATAPARTAAESGDQAVTAEFAR